MVLIQISNHIFDCDESHLRKSSTYFSSLYESNILPYSNNQEPYILNIEEYKFNTLLLQELLISLFSNDQFGIGKFISKLIYYLCNEEGFLQQGKNEVEHYPIKEQLFELIDYLGLTILVNELFKRCSFDFIIKHFINNNIHSITNLLDLNFKKSWIQNYITTTIISNLKDHGNFDDIWLNNINLDFFKFKFNNVVYSTIEFMIENNNFDEKLLFEIWNQELCSISSCLKLNYSKLFAWNSFKIKKDLKEDNEIYIRMLVDGDASECISWLIYTKKYNKDIECLIDSWNYYHETNYAYLYDDMDLHEIYQQILIDETIGLKWVQRYSLEGKDLYTPEAIELFEYKTGFLYPYFILESHTPFIINSRYQTPLICIKYKDSIYLTPLNLLTKRCNYMSIDILKIRNHRTFNITDLLFNISKDCHPIVLNYLLGENYLTFVTVEQCKILSRFVNQLGLINFFDFILPSIINVKFTKEDKKECFNLIFEKINCFIDCINDSDIENIKDVLVLFWYTQSHIKVDDDIEYKIPSSVLTSCSCKIYLKIKSGKLITYEDTKKLLLYELNNSITYQLSNYNIIEKINDITKELKEDDEIKYRIAITTYKDLYEVEIYTICGYITFVNNSIQYVEFVSGREFDDMKIEYISRYSQDKQKDYYTSEFIQKIEEEMNVKFP